MQYATIRSNMSTHNTNSSPGSTFPKRMTPHWLYNVWLLQITQIHAACLTEVVLIHFLLSAPERDGGRPEQRASEDEMATWLKAAAALDYGPAGPPPPRGRKASDLRLVLQFGIFFFTNRRWCRSDREVKQISCVRTAWCVWTQQSRFRHPSAGFDPNNVSTSPF